jgi:two-component system CheB/CheR fusion protein
MPSHIEDDDVSRPGAGSPATGGMDGGQPLAIVGVGASAGGLDAFKKLLAALPSNTGMAFVLIQHLDPMHASLMANLLSSHTLMPVSQAVDGALIEPNRVYLIPPACSLAVMDGRLRLAEPSERHGARMPFDFFLRSLAEDCGDRAICIVLSGTGSDGSEGLRAIKDRGGLIICQEPSEAAFDGMPKSAIKTGKADLILPVAKMPAALMKQVRRFKEPHALSDKKTNIESRLGEILALVRTKTGHDFTLYKAGTLTRRIERRMAVAGISDIARYLEKLGRDGAELDCLAEDLLINVTQFFRDAAAFQALAEGVVPEMIATHPLETPLRIWVPGCSTGEEAYSLAITFIEAIEAAKRNLKLQVFASDIDAHSIETARAGAYGREIEAQVGLQRLARFFSREGESYRVIRELRETVVFTVQDLLSDPPFSRLDLISCRNVLIYMRPEAQEKILSLFHFTLRVGGILFLGSSETVGNSTDRFEPIDKKQRIYRHLSASRTGEAEFRASTAALERVGPSFLPVARKILRRRNLGDIASKLLVDFYAPPSALVDKKYEALFYSGDVDRYLQLAPGETNRNILVMAREGMRPKLRSALEKARETGGAAFETGAQVYRDAKTVGVKITVQPVPAEELFLISFIDEPDREPPAVKSVSPEDESRILQLEQELDATRRELNAVIRDLEISNEDQRDINEEALSINEELQSANEELETSKEELQSLNEELTALNAQLQETLEHQRTTAADLQNILNSSDVATLFLDREFKIRFFTPAVKALFGVAAVDIGRPLIDLAPRFHDDALLPDARAVLAKLTPIRREIESHDANWYIRSILPYQNDVNAVEGVVITFARISEMKAAERKIEAARAYAQAVIDTIKQPLIVLDQDLRVVSASASFFEIFAVKPEDYVGQPFALEDRFRGEAVAKFLTPAGNGEGLIADREIKIDLPNLGFRTLRLSARRILASDFGPPRILISVDDITEANAKTEALAAAKEEAERANLAKSRFLAAASHDLRQPLQTMSLLQGMLSDRDLDPSAKDLVRRLDSTVSSMSGLLDKLLDINQLEAGVVQPKVGSFVINDLLDQLKAEFEIHAQNDGLRLRVVPCHFTVRSDPRLLEQILRNLLSNAMKYTNKGKVLLGCRRGKDRLRIEVWDTGTGIPETELSAIFKEFHQLDNRVVKRARGLGLGLTIVQRLCDLLKAPITVRSREGRGSVFAVEVQIVEQPDAATAPAQPPAMHPNTSESPPPRIGKIILVVEDDAEVRETLKLLLNSHGYRTFAARDGTEAIALAGENGADLIVADYNLPGPNGLEIIDKIEQNLAKKMPAIILTGDISASTLLDIASKGHTHLYKPADARILIRNINSMLEPKDREVSEPSASRVPTVFVVDDDRDVREAMRDMLETLGYRAEIFADSSSFLKAYSLDRTGCLVADVRMPGIGGMELVERLQAMQSPLPVIMITAYGDVAMAVKAMKSGALDFLQKPVRQDELLSCIERALKYDEKHPSLAVERAIAVKKIESLTPRQRQILDKVLGGAPTKIIASDLNLSERTVDNHRAAIMRKVGAKSLSALIRMALAASTEFAAGSVR